MLELHNIWCCQQQVRVSGGYLQWLAVLSYELAARRSFVPLQLASAEVLGLSVPRNATKQKEQ